MKQTYHRSGSSERSGVGDQVCQGVLLPRSVNYVGIVRHHDRHLLHHFDPGSRMEDEDKVGGGGGGGVVEVENKCS